MAKSFKPEEYEKWGKFISDKTEAIKSNTPPSDDWEHYADRLHDIAYESGKADTIKAVLEIIKDVRAECLEGTAYDRGHESASTQIERLVKALAEGAEQ